MKILDEQPTHYHVRLPSGHEMVIARTPGTETMVKAAQSLAGGGTVEGGPVTDSELADYYDKHPDLERGPDMDAMLRRDLPKMRAGAVRDRNFAAENPLNIDKGTEAGGPAPVPNPTPEPGSAFEMPPAAEPTFSPMVSGSTGGTSVAGQGQPGQIEQALSAREAAIAKIEAAKGAEAEARDAVSPDLQKALASEGGTAAAAPPDLGAYEKAQKDYADVLARGEEAKANAIAGAQIPAPPPPPKPIDPGQLYERVGAMLGADSPTSRRIVGGIATGLMSGLGEVGAALSHRENTAAKMIQDAIQQNIAAQQGAQALTRQQWMDQTTYATALANRKVEEIAARSNSEAIRAKVPVMVAENNIAQYQALAKLGMMDPKQAAPLVAYESARAAIATLAPMFHDVAKGFGLKWSDLMNKAHIEDNRKVQAVFTQIDLTNHAIAQAMQPGSTRDQETQLITSSPAAFLKATDSPEQRDAKLVQFLQSNSQRARATRIAAHGYDPSGSGTRVDARPE